MNRIEKKLQSLQEKKEKAFITYITAGLPDKEHCAKLIRAQEEAGLDILELGIPFSDPAAYHHRDFGRYGRKPYSAGLISRDA